MATPTKPTAADAVKDINGSANDDYLLGTSGDDIIYGAATFAAGFAADGIDILQGGAGDDQYIVNDLVSTTVGTVTTVTTDTIIEFDNEGVDTVFASVNYTLPVYVENIAASAGAVTLTGNSLANILDGSQGTAGAVDTLKGMEGNDTYISGTTQDKVIEGKIASATATQYTDTGGIDTIVSATTVSLTALITDAGQKDTIVGTGTSAVRTVATDRIVGQAFIENVVITGSATGVDITGNAKDNRLTGNSAANAINGGAGNDTLDGNGGGDALTGGVGNDTFIQRNSGDTFIEAAAGGTDTIISTLTTGTVTASDNIENITLTGTSDVDATGNGNLANTIKGNSGDNELNGGTDTGTNKIADTLWGLQGNDILDGGLGSDVMYGGRGNDVYKVDGTGDVVNEAVAGGGTDRVDSSVTYSLNTTAAAEVENLTLTLTGLINATGNARPNNLIGNSNANILDGGIGADDLRGNGGNDTYVVDNTLDTIIEAASKGTDLVKFTAASGQSYTLSAHVENITLMGITNIGATTTAHSVTAEVKHTMTGNSGNNAMTGGLNNDTLIGNAGNDTLNGGAGAGDDIITGGTGKDTVTTGDGQDTVKFASGVADTVATATSVAGIDVYSDLVLDNDTSDLIDLTVIVANIDTAVTAATIAEATFIANMNTALIADGVGFDTNTGDISAAVVTATAGGGGVTAGDKFLAVDLDKSGTFTATDFVIEITGSTLTQLDVSTFI